MAKDALANREGSVPPGPRSHHLRQQLAWFRRPVAFLEDCRNRYGPIFAARFGPDQHAVFVSDPADVRTIVTGDPELLRMGDSNGLFRPVVGSNSILLLDGEEHQRHRRMMLPALRRDHVERFTEVIEESVVSRIEAWPMDTPIALKEEMEAIAFDTIMRIVFGLERSPREARLRELFPPMMDLCESPYTLLPFFRHRLSGRSPYGRLLDLLVELDDVLFRAISDRRADPYVEEREDLLSVLVRARVEDGTPMTDQELRDELLTMLMAGQETTTAALSWAFERLARNQAVTDRVVGELERGDQGYLDATIREILRQRPPIPVAARKLRAPLELGDYVVPAGWVVMACIHLLHREPAVYPDPDEFRPERFLLDPPPKHAWLPFGGGVRRCLGANLAQLEMRVVLRTVLPRIRFEPVSDAPEAIRRRRFAFSPAEDATLVLSERSPAAVPRVKVPV
jgi:cytochrome P450 family 135